MYTTSEIAIAVLQFLKDGEIHTIPATTLHLQSFFNLTNKEKNELQKAKAKSKDHTPLSSTQFYHIVARAIHVLRKAKLLKDFPKTKNQGIFLITDGGLNLLKKNRNEIKKEINYLFRKYIKKK